MSVRSGLGMRGDRRILASVCWNLIDMDQAELATIAGDMGVAEPSDAFAEVFETIPAR